MGAQPYFRIRQGPRRSDADEEVRRGFAHHIADSSQQDADACQQQSIDRYGKTQGACEDRDHQACEKNNERRHDHIEGAHKRLNTEAARRDRRKNGREEREEADKRRIEKDTPRFGHEPVGYAVDVPMDRHRFRQTIVERGGGNKR